MANGKVTTLRVQLLLCKPGDPSGPLELEVPTDATIEHLKKSLAEVSGTPVRYQELRAADDAGRVFQDDQTLADSGLLATRSLVLARLPPDKGILRACCKEHSDEFSGTDIRERVELARYILKHGEEDPNALDDSGSTLLHDAVQLGSVEICSGLLGDSRFHVANARRPSVELSRCYGNPTYHDATALHLAAALDRGDICKLLLDDGRVDANAKSRGGFSALHFAVAQRSLSSCLALLQHTGYDVNAVDDSGMSALQVAVACCMPESEQVIVATFLPGDIGVKLAWGDFWLHVTEVTPEGQGARAGVEVGMKLKLADNRMVPKGVSIPDDLMAGRNSYRLEFHKNEKYRLHPMTEDGGCWFSSQRLECREASEKICEALLAQRERFTTADTELRERFEYAKAALTSDRHWQTRTLSVTARYSSGEVACSFGITAQESSEALIDEAKTQVGSPQSDDINGRIVHAGKVIDCKIVYADEVLMSAGVIWSLFDRGSHGEPFQPGSHWRESDHGASSSWRITLLRNSDFRARLSDGSLQAEMRYIDDEKYLDDFGEYAPDEYDCANPILSLSDPSSAKYLSQQPIPLAIARATVSIEFSATGQHVLFKTPTEQVFSYDVKEKTFQL